MTVLVDKKAKNIEEGIKNLIEGSVLDYNQWSDKANINYCRLNEDNFTTNEGRNYIKIIRSDTGSRSAHCFVVKKDTKKFKAGDILMSASWKTPATNKSRGNVLEGNFPIQWTGAVYL